VGTGPEETRPATLMISTGRCSGIGKAGAANAALLAAEILAGTDSALYDRLAAWRAARTQEVLDQKLGEEQAG